MAFISVIELPLVLVTQMCVLSAATWAGKLKP